MIETELKVGRLIKGDAFVGPRTKIVAGTFYAQSKVPLKIEKSTMVETSRNFASRSPIGGHVMHTNIPAFQSNVAPGEGPKVGRNFQWLSYYPGMISHVPCVTDVLTGPMSGCWVVVFKLAGVAQAGHIGTEQSTTSENSKAVKAAWKQYAAVHKADVIGGFQPYKHGMTLPPRLQSDASTPTVFGAVAAQGPKFYSVITYRQGTAGKVYRIASVTECGLTFPDFA